MDKNDQHILEKALLNSWSLKSSSKWSKANPAKGQCGVTALVVNDILGGKILKTKMEEGWHYYNFIDGKRLDFTTSQFQQPIRYMDINTEREDAFSDTNESQYRYLKQSVFNFIKQGEKKSFYL